MVSKHFQAVVQSLHVRLMSFSGQGRINKIVVLQKNLTFFDFAVLPADLCGFTIHPHVKTNFAARSFLTFSPLVEPPGERGEGITRVY